MGSVIRIQFFIGKGSAVGWFFIAALLNVEAKILRGLRASSKAGGLNFFVFGMEMEVLPSAQRLLAKRLRDPYLYLSRCAVPPCPG